MNINQITSSETMARDYAAGKMELYAGIFLHFIVWSNTEGGA